MKYLMYALACATLTQCIENPSLRVQTKDLVIEFDTAASQLAYDTLKIPKHKIIAYERLIRIKVRNIGTNNIEIPVLSDSLIISSNESYPVDFGRWQNKRRFYCNYTRPIIPPQGEKEIYLRYNSRFEPEQHKHLKPNYTEDDLLPDSVRVDFCYTSVRDIDLRKDVYIYIYLKMNKNSVAALRSRD